jgi:hypothetical protein
MSKITKAEKKHKKALKKLAKPGHSWRVIHEVDGVRRQKWIRTKRKHIKAVCKAMELRVVRIEEGWHYDWFLSPV